MDEELAKAYVKELADTYNTYGKVRIFNLTDFIQVPSMHFLRFGPVVKRHGRNGSQHQNQHQRQINGLAERISDKHYRLMQNGS